MNESSNKLNNIQFKKIFQISNKNINNKKLIENFTGKNLKNILSEIKSNKNGNVKSLTHFLKFNSMYFSNTEGRNKYTKKFYEVYSSFIMILEISTYIKSILQEYINQNNANQNLSKDIQIRENINMNTTVFNKEDIDNTLLYKKIKYLFGSSTNKPLHEKTKQLFKKYKYQKGLITLSDNDLSNITLFETLFLRYNNNERLLKIIPKLIKQYNNLKSKIFDILCDNDTKEVDFGLLGFGFLFAYENFPNVTDDIDVNIFINKKLYDMATKNINIESEINKLVAGHNNIGLNLASHLDYFYNNSYRDANFYNTLIKALDMDICGLKFALFYIHSTFLEVFLKRKYKIDKQIYNYLQSYATKIESLNTSTFKFEDPSSQFMNPSNEFYRDFDDYIK